MQDAAARPLHAPPAPVQQASAPDAARERDALLARYRAIAGRAHALVDAQMPAPGSAPDAILREIEDLTHRLGPYVSAMPGARAQSAAEIAGLREPDLPGTSAADEPPV